MTLAQASKVLMASSGQRSGFVKVVRAAKGGDGVAHAATETGDLACGNKPHPDATVIHVSAELKDTTCRTCRSQLGLDDSDEANGRLEALFVISITLGLRPGELRKLTWDHVDLDKGVIAGGAWHDNDLVFCHENGDPYTSDQLNWRFSKMTRKAGIGRWHAHEGRHTAVSIMSSNGVPIQDISDTVGHKSTHVTETVYRHVIVPEIRGGATVMDDVFDDPDEGN
jgi:hypothetical protein